METKIDNLVTEITKINLPPSVASTFENSVYKTVTTNQSVTLNRAFGNQAYLKGGFATTKANATRSELALLDEWNNSMHFEATIDIPAGQTLNIGKVAPQTSTMVCKRLQEVETKFLCHKTGIIKVGLLK